MKLYRPLFAKSNLKVFALHGIAFFNQWHMISKMGLMNSEANVHFEEKEPGV